MCTLHFACHDLYFEIYLKILLIKYLKIGYGVTKRLWSTNYDGTNIVPSPHEPLRTAQITNSFASLYRPISPFRGILQLLHCYIEFPL